MNVLEQLYKRPVMPLVALSNLSQSEDKNRALAPGTSKFFIKADAPLATVVEEVRRI